MKIFALKSIYVALVLGSVSQVATAADGEINFIGTVTANTCVVAVDDLNGGPSGDVSLGNVQATALATAGEIAGGGAFTLTITDGGTGTCDLTGAVTVRFQTLSGTAGAQGQWFGVTGTAPATNVAVQIKDFTGKDVQIGLASEAYDDLSKPLRFTANYIATGTATPGDANAKAAFTVDYQ